MKHDDDRLNMWFSLMVSILLHVAVILLVPITITHHVTVYPVEFGEISQTFASTRQGSPAGTPLPTPPKSQTTTVQEKAAEKQEIVKETKAPAEPERQKTAEEPKPEPAPQPKPETVVAKAEPETVAPKPEPETTTPAPEPETVVAPEPEPETVTPAPEPETITATPETETEDLGRVLTGSSDEVIQIPEAKEASPAPEPKATSEPGNHAQGSNDTEGRSYATDETGGDKGTAAKDEPVEAQKSGPEKPKGHEFGTGESLAINSAPPRYPKGAQNVDLIGTVKLDVQVDKDGNIRGVELSQASGYDELDEQARMTILALWKFKGINWPYRIQVTVSFRGEANVDVQFGGVTVLED